MFPSGIQGDRSLVRSSSSSPEEASSSELSTNASRMFRNPSERPFFELISKNGAPLSARSSVCREKVDGWIS